MSLVQLGTTASRANREKSVNNSIAQRIVQWSYRGNAAGSECDGYGSRQPAKNMALQRASRHCKDLQIDRGTISEHNLSHVWGTTLGCIRKLVASAFRLGSVPPSGTEGSS
jgi:hypothetical protein